MNKIIKIAVGAVIVSAVIIYKVKTFKVGPCSPEVEHKLEKENA